MTNDPGSMGGLGGFDLGAMLEQAQAMQAQLMSAQAQLAEQTVDGSAGGVQVTVSGTGELVGVHRHLGHLRRHRRGVARRPRRPRGRGVPRRQGQGRRLGGSRRWARSPVAWAVTWAATWAADSGV